MDLPAKDCVCYRRTFEQGSTLFFFGSQGVYVVTNRLVLSSQWQGKIFDMNIWPTLDQDLFAADHLSMTLVSARRQFLLL